MRDQMKIGELAFFYHSNCKEPGIAGLMEVYTCCTYCTCTLYFRNDLNFHEMPCLSMYKNKENLCYIENGVKRQPYHMIIFLHRL